MKKRTPLKYNASHALRQVRGAITSARLAKELETNNKFERANWLMALADLFDVERSLDELVGRLAGSMRGGGK